MEAFTLWLSDVLQKSVVDRTGFTGAFDVNLQWLQDPPLPAVTAPGAQPTATEADSGVLSIFTAIQEQLGLKLESAKGPVEVLVIDRAEPPTEN
jgi:uncharacterized protein (TIGR03435 family)